MNLKICLPVDFIITYFLIHSSEFSFLGNISIVKHLCAVACMDILKTASWLCY